MKVLIIHNEESERLAYLVPRAEELARNIESVAGSCALELIGPKERHGSLVPDTLSNRLRRALDAARLFAVMERRSPSPNGTFLKLAIGLRTFAQQVASRRSLTIEQDTVRGHAECWKRIAEDGDSAIVMENDVVFRSDSASKLVNWSLGFSEMQALAPSSST